MWVLYVYHHPFHNENSVLFRQEQFWDKTPTLEQNTQDKMSALGYRTGLYNFLTRRLKNKLKKISKYGTAKARNTTYKGKYNSGLKKHPVPHILEIVRLRTT